MDINIGILSEHYPEHKHKYYEIIAYTKGEGVLLANKQEFPFSPGTIIILPPETPHVSISEGDFERIYVAGNLEFIISISSPILLSGENDDDGMLLARLIYQNRYKNPDYLTSLLSAFINYILHSIEITDKIDEAISKIVGEISERFSDCNINLSSILKSSGYAEDYIRDRFKRSTGKTPVRFLTEIRISHAKLLIDLYKSAISLSEIAEKSGFTDYVYFSRRFKEIAGVSPREYASSK